jgi:hypothetical protein
MLLGNESLDQLINYFYYAVNQLTSSPHLLCVHELNASVAFVTHYLAINWVLKAQTPFSTQV